MYKKFLSFTFLTLFISTWGFSKVVLKTFVSPGDEPPRTAHHVIGNWNNQMDPSGCVLLDNSNDLKITGLITVGDSSLSQYPDLYVFTQFNGEPSVTYGPITSNDLDPFELANGQIVYVYQIEGYVGNFNDYCNQTPEVPLPFDYEITSVDENGDPYPISSYPSLLTPMNPPDQGEEETRVIYETSSYAGTKDLCCYGTSGNPGVEGFVQNTGDATEVNSTEHIHQATVFPNPFSKMLTIKMRLSIAETTTIQLWDINGRLVYFEEYIPERSGQHKTEIDTRDLNAGFYYCTLKNDSQSETFKVLKLD